MVDAMAQGGTDGSSADGGTGAGATGGSAGGGDPTCTTTTFEIPVTSVDKVDLLFVVDNSGSMAEEQASLRREFPKLIDVLTTGERTPGDPNPFPPAEDLHLGVVSSDMGLVGITGIPGCEGLGDDGVMNNIPNIGGGSTGCQATYPRFLTYLADVNDPTTTANDFGCIANLGTNGCGFEQPLEAGLKALWPSVDVDHETGMVIEPNRILFLGDAMGFGQLGHGDLENGGFLRNDPLLGISLIAIVVVTDEEDCSSADTSHFTPDIFLDPNDPLAMQDLSLRCHFNPQNLYKIERYVNGFKTLRAGQESLVVFAAIVGVPPDLVSAEARAAVDFADGQARDTYYAGILADPRMTETVDTSQPPGEGNLLPSCSTSNGVAYPPRRLVEVAREFGEQGVVQSICQDDFGPAMDAVIDVIGEQLGAVCLPRPLTRDAEGLVGCNVVWELPPPGTAPSGTPTSCSAQPFLSTPQNEDAATSASGGEICVVQQLAVSNGAPRATGSESEGWYYDDFSDGALSECRSTTPQRVAFTAQAQPPLGVTVKLECGDPCADPSDSTTDPATPDPVDPLPAGPCTDGEKSTDPCPQVGTSCASVGGSAVACCVDGAFEQQISPSGGTTVKCQCEQPAQGVIVSCAP